MFTLMTLKNYEIIKAGYAFWYPYASGTDFDTQYEEAQTSASNNAVGLWTESSYNFTIDYIEYDPEGSEADGEYLILTNHENFNVSMVGWFLQDRNCSNSIRITTIYYFCGLQVFEFILE